MILEPGLLNDLSGDAQAEWDEFVTSCLTGAIRDSGTVQFVAPNDPDLSGDILPVDWKGFPVRIRECLQSERKAAAFLDWVRDGQPWGRLLGAQEEYLEWRVVKDAHGRITRMEFSSETPEFWQILAKHHPTRTLRLLGDFAGEQAPAAPQDVYGVADPNALSPDERADAFYDMMCASGAQRDTVKSPYNNGQKAIACMIAGPNTLQAAIMLAAYAAFAYVKKVGNEAVPLTGREAIQCTTQSAQDCRDSDPTIIGSLINLAAKGRKISLYNPPGLYIAGVDAGSILMPDGNTPIPRDWFTLQRGSKVENGGQTFSLAQRLVFEPPASSGITISDLIDEHTDEPIRHGADIACRVTMSVYALASDAGCVEITPQVYTPVPVTPCCTDEGCTDIKTNYAQFEQSRQRPPVVTPPGGTLRR